jgi:hypothetical protein
MPLRVYCPDCAAPRTAPAPGARVRCRNCDRVFRAGTRVERRPARDDADDDAPGDDSPASRNLLFVLGGVALVLIGLTIGGGLAAWYFVNRLPDPPPDDEVVEPDDPQFQPPPAVGPPVNPGPIPPDNPN